MPALDPTLPMPATAPPPGSKSLAYDVFHNHWALSAADSNGCRSLLVLPAQASQSWLTENLSNLDAHQWNSLAADNFGGIWIAAAHRLQRLDPHHPEKVRLDLSQHTELALGHDSITALGVAPSGGLLVALASGRLVTINHDAGTGIQSKPAPPAIETVCTDADGNVWARAKGRVYREPAAVGAWQRDWQLISRLPGGNHDLSGDEMNGCFYMAGGQNGGWGYPAQPHVFDQVFALEPGACAWRVAGRLMHPRFYNGTSYLDGKIWIIAGNRRDSNGAAVTLDTTEICDPLTGEVYSGPHTPFPLEMPVALHISGRIYVAGGVNPKSSFKGRSHSYDASCKLISIGPGEQAWREEPEGPAGVGAPAAASLNGKFYLTVPHRGLFFYDTARRTWRQTASPPAPPRSAQVAAFRNEIWVMGGRDIEDMRQTLIYNPETDQWRIGPSLPFDLAWGAGGVFGGHLMVAGGANMRFYSNGTYLLRNK